jgi:hypothetical protein
VAAPPNPKIYHITHLDNLASIVADGHLCSDAKRIRDGKANTNIGMSAIKKRRLEAIAVNCHPQTTVGEYVPFYFCPRSIMLYLIYRQNPELLYKSGQRPIVHLQADLNTVIRWAEAENHRWTFCKSNAGTYYTEFYSSLEQLDQINWDAVRASDFRDSLVKEGKQAEFLIYDTFPWQLVERIGVIDSEISIQIAPIVEQANHQPEILVQRNWYF